MKKNWCLYFSNSKSNSCFMVLILISISKSIKQAHISYAGGILHGFANSKEQAASHNSQAFFFKHWTTINNFNQPCVFRTRKLRKLISWQRHNQKLNSQNMQRPRRRCEGTAMGAIVLDLRPGLGVGPFSLGILSFCLFFSWLCL